MSKENHVFATLGAQNFHTEIINENHVFHADEPVADGGQDIASHPMAYLLGALASCVAITLRMYVQRKEWDVGEIKVAVKKVDEITEAGKRTRLEKQLSFGNEVTAEQKKRLLKIADKCPVSLLLKNETAMTAEIVGD